MDPYSAAFSAIGGAAAGGPSSAANGAVDQRLYQDGSGWTVATSSGGATGATIVRSGEESPMGAGLAAGLAGGLGTPMMLALLALAAVVAIKALRK